MDSSSHAEGLTGRVGIIAGGGDLPRRLIDTLIAAGTPPAVVALDGHVDRDLSGPGVALAALPIGAAGKIIDHFRDSGVRRLVLAGAVRRPSLSEIQPDWRGAKLLARIAGRLMGDDGLLRAVAQELEGEGFTVVAPGALLRTFAMPAGLLGGIQAEQAALDDVARGMVVLAALGALDIGQAAVVQQGVVLGVEAAEGTDALIARCAGLARPGSAPVLVKAVKGGQDRRLDPPVIGKATVAALAKAGFAGLAAEAGGVILLDRVACIEAADAAGLFLLGLVAAEPG